LNIWCEVDYFSRGGKAIHLDSSVHITIIPLTLGLKYIYCFNKHYGIYLGAGGKYYFVQMINRFSPLYHRNTFRHGLGGVVEIGNEISINKHFVIDVFASASFKRIHGASNLPSNTDGFGMQIGGWNVGGAVGYKF
jgi:outer membrane protein W